MAPVALGNPGAVAGLAGKALVLGIFALFSGKGVKVVSLFVLFAFKKDATVPCPYKVVQLGKFFLALLLLEKPFKYLFPAVAGGAPYFHLLVKVCPLSAVSHEFLLAVAVDADKALFKVNVRADFLDKPSVFKLKGGGLPVLKGSTVTLCFVKALIGKADPSASVVASDAVFHGDVSGDEGVLVLCGGSAVFCLFYVVAGSAAAALFRKKGGKGVSWKPEVAGAAKFPEVVGGRAFGRVWPKEFFDCKGLVVVPGFAPVVSQGAYYAPVCGHKAIFYVLYLLYVASLLAAGPFSHPQVSWV